MSLITCSFCSRRIRASRSDRAVSAAPSTADRWSEKGVRLVQKIQVGPCIPAGKQLQRAEVGPTSGPTWHISHLGGLRRRALVDVDHRHLEGVARGDGEEQGHVRRRRGGPRPHVRRDLAPRPRQLKRTAPRYTIAIDTVCLLTWRCVVMSSYLSQNSARSMVYVQIAWGSVALSLCTTTHPLYTRFTKRFGASVSETTMRPNPKIALGVRFLRPAL
jgi:hypothetical protein